MSKITLAAKEWRGEGRGKGGIGGIYCWQGALDMLPQARGSTDAFLSSSLLFFQPVSILVGIPLPEEVQAGDIL
jgi:hypothetical protein